MEFETKIVHREESFMDHALDEIAYTRAACCCKIQFGMCTKDECKSCSLQHEFAKCYSQMTDYDKYRFPKYIAKYYSELSAHPEGFQPFDVLLRNFIIGVSAVIAGFAVFMGLIYCALQ